MCKLFEGYKGQKDYAKAKEVKRIMTRWRRCKWSEGGGEIASLRQRDRKKDSQIGHSCQAIRVGIWPAAGPSGAEGIDLPRPSAAGFYLL